MPGDRMEIAVQILKMAGDTTLIEGTITVVATVVARGKLGFAQRTLEWPGPGDSAQWPAMRPFIIANTLEFPQCACAGAKLAGEDQFPTTVGCTGHPLTGKIVVRVTPHRTAVRPDLHKKLQNGA